MLEEYLISAWQFSKSIFKRVWIWLPSLLLDPFDLYGNYYKKFLPSYVEGIVNMITTWGLPVLLILIVCAAIKAYHELRIQIEPSLKIDFKGRLRSSSYFQEMKVIMPLEYGESFEAMNQTYRICIKNTGIKAIENVQVKLNSIEPCPDNLFRTPLPLRFMNENNKWSKTISSGQDEFVDVVSFPKGEETRNKIFIEHLHTDIGHLIERNKYNIEIIATGNNVLESKRRFAIYIENNELFMNPI